MRISDWSSDVCSSDLETTASTACCGAMNARSVNITVMSDSELVPYTVPSPSPSLALPTAPPWQMLQVTPMLPVQLPSVLRSCVRPIGNTPLPPLLAFGSSPGNG